MQDLTLRLLCAKALLGQTGGLARLFNRGRYLP